MKRVGCKYTQTYYHLVVYQLEDVIWEWVGGSSGFCLPSQQTRQDDHVPSSWEPESLLGIVFFFSLDILKILKNLVGFFFFGISADLSNNISTVKRWKLCSTGCRECPFSGLNARTLCVVCPSGVSPLESQDRPPASWQDPLFFTLFYRCKPIECVPPLSLKKTDKKENDGREGSIFSHIWPAHVSTFWSGK